ncbi:MAG: TonB-dependent receptor [Acidobacteria bacterium]|nr:TonB-dependent receptor [Acidobacteriota bacterium]
MPFTVTPRSWVVPLLLLLLIPIHALAQDATIVGLVVDEQKLPVPGATVTATSASTGRKFVGATDDRGEYRLAGLAAGRYAVSAELGGFATITLADVELLVGQNATLPFVMKLAATSESLTVTAEAPLVDLLQARVAGNVDRRQMEALPIAGRNWQQLTSMVKGITANTITARPGVARDAAFSLNLDGQDITQNASTSGFGQPGISREAIAEFQVITNLFDVTMGRSTGIQVQAITRAGTNLFSGSAYGYFRDDALNAKDPFAGRVLPYANRQMGFTVGGPIVRNRLHFFGSYEDEKEPNTSVFTVSALGSQRFEIPTERTARTGLVRVDYQLDRGDHLTMRSGYWRDLSNTVSGHPSREVDNRYDSNYTSVAWSRAAGTRVHELKVNAFHYHWLVEPLAVLGQTPNYSFPGLALGGPSNQPQNWFEDFVTTRYDLSTRLGAHDLKIGAELRLGGEEGWWLKGSRGTMTFSRLPSDIGARIPADAALDPNRWNLAGLDALAQTFTINYARLGGGKDGYGDFSFDTPRPMIAGWIGDTWRVTPAMTLNLGVRYDVAWQDLVAPGVANTEILVDSGLGAEDFGYRSDIRDLNNVAPRVGAAWRATDDGTLVIRGGTGIYYSSANSNQPVDASLWNGQRVISSTFTNDGKPGWVLDPTRGVTADDVLSGRVPPQPQSPVVIAHDFKMPYAWQSMIGFQKQLTPVLGIDVDLVHYKGYNEDSQRDPNLFYDAATGLPRNPNVHGRPNPAYGVINLKESHGRSDYLALAAAATRRYANRFQIGATYTYMFYKRDTGIGSAGYGATQLNPFDIMADWAPSADYQEHTLRVNGVWNVPFQDLTVAGSAAYGSGNPTSITTNVDPLGTGANRVRADLSVIPRNTFFGESFKTVDVRLSKDIPLGATMRLTAIAEVFNLFNSARYRYNTLETSPTFGQPNASGGSPRTGQLAFKITF